VAATARVAAGQAQFRWGDRLVAGGGGRLTRAGGEGRTKSGPSPVDRSRTGSKHHLITDGGGMVFADRAYDHDKYRKLVRGKGIQPIVARRAVEHGSGLGAYRWVVEQCFALLHWFRRLRIRWEVRDDIHEAFLSLGCSIICWRRLKTYSLC
jgi:transposase